jgi:hypothetical protein
MMDFGAGQGLVHVRCAYALARGSRQESGSFLKKRTKKLLRVFTRDVSTSPGEQKSFAELFCRKATSF